MQFCPKCNNMLDISRTAPKIIIGLDAETPTTLSSTSDDKDIIKVVKKYLNGDKLELEDVKTINIDSLIKNDEFNELKESSKTELLKIINILLTDTDDSISAFKICKNCSYFEHIQDNTLVISRMNATTSVVFDDKSKYSYMRYDRSLPHTRDYICKKNDCKSHKDYTLRNAVWFRPITDSYTTYYVCVTCGTHWVAS